MEEKRAASLSKTKQNEVERTGYLHQELKGGENVTLAIVCLEE